MAWKVCALNGCPRATQSRYCPEHERAKDKARGTQGQRGYGRQFQALRRRYVEKHRTQPLECWRCQSPIPIGQPFHLGHSDEDRELIMGPECPSCNLSAAGKASHRYK